MKRSISFLVLLLVAFPVAFAQQYGWKDLSENIPVEAELTDVFFVSEDEGWITTIFAGPIILHTTDGGETFEQQQVPLEGDLLAIHMLDNLHGYCGISSGFIFKTEDGGANWNILASMGTFTDISFPPDANPDDPVGYACGDFGNVWRITDELTNLNSGSSVTFRGISTSTVNNVWSCGGNRIYHYNGNEFISQIAPAGSFNDIHFTNDDEGWVVGDGGVIGKTTNSGDLWITLTNPDPQDRTPYSVYFLDSDNGWAVGNDGLIMHTEDGGDTWIIEPDGLTNEDLSGVHFTSPTNGYVVGNNSILLKFTQVSGVEDNRQTIEFTLFPNPADESVRIKCSAFRTEAGTIEILSTEGKTFQKRTVGKGNTDIEMELKDLAKGMYMCRINIGNKTASMKLIIE